MRNWIIAFATGSTLFSIMPVASAQEVKRTGDGAASVACAFGLDNGMYSCLGPGSSQQSFSTPDGSASVINNVTIAGMRGSSRITMSEINIQISGSASFTPPSSCEEGRIGGQGPTYFANGSQSVYADVPNGTPIRITINASASGTGGGWASWSDAKSGAGGASATTVFNAVAGPGKITVSGVDYYLIDTISASGAAGARLICSAANSQSFSASVSLQFEVLGTNLRKLYGDGSGPVGSRLPNPLSVRVLDTATGEFVNGVNINFERDDAEPCAEGFSANPNFTATKGKDSAKGIARSYVNLPQQPGKCVYKATCASCLGNRKETFKVEATPLPTLDISGDESGGKKSGGGPSPTGGGGSGGGGDPLMIEYARLGKVAFTRPPDGGFVGVLTGDQAQFRAVPQEGTLQWRRDSVLFAGGVNVFADFTQERLITNPSIVSVRRAEDGKSESVSVLVEARPTGPVGDVMLALIISALCRNDDTAIKCARFLESRRKAYAWAEAHFEPAGRSGGSCHNNCCDAAKHAVWHAVVTKLVGLAESQQISIAHEVDEVNGPHNETVMDLHNNRLGQAIGQATSGTSYETIGADMMQRLRAGDALVLYNPWNDGGLSMLEGSSRCAQ